MHTPNWLSLQGAVNVRDIGGLQISRDHATRTGVLVRADALGDLTHHDVAMLVDHVGVHQVIDLRSQRERETQPPGRLAEAGVTHHHVELLTDTMMDERRDARAADDPQPDPDADADANAGEGEGGGEAVLDGARTVAEAYWEFLSLGRGALTEALAHVVTAAGRPTIVHCTAGKDRTGVVVAMLLDAAGVLPGSIVADYAATALRLPHIIARLAAMPAYAQLATQPSAPMLSAHAATMELFLDRLHAEHGGAAPWFLEAGASPCQLATWRQILIH